MASFRTRFRALLAATNTFDEVLRAACEEVERRQPGVRVAIFEYDGGHLRMRAASAPLPTGFVAAVTGTASDAPWLRGVARNAIVSFADMSSDPAWAGQRAAVADAGLAGGWFVPLVTTIGRKVGLMAVVHDRPYRPSRAERARARRVADVTAVAIQRERLRAENREADSRLKSLMANVPGVVFQWAVAPGGAPEFLFVSDSAESVTGLPSGEITMRPRRLLGRIARRDRQRLIAACGRSVRRMKPISEDVPLDCGDRGMRWLRVMSRPRRRDDGRVLSDALALDITENRLAEERLRRNQDELRERLIELHRTKARLESQGTILMETAEELTRARDAAEQASRAKSEFLSNMSHELRTPLNAIIGFSEIIRQQTFGPVGSPKYRDYAGDIYVSGLHLLELINEILEFAKIEAGREQLNCDTFDFAEIVAATIQIVHERAERAGLTLETRLASGLPRISADRRKVRQVLLNLLSNAIKFTDRGGRVTISAWCADSSGFVIQVADTGIGIALEDIPKALGLFGQIDNPFSRRHEGTGLGLPLSKALVEMHGGSLDLQSQPGTGTTVTVRLPAERIVRTDSPQPQMTQQAG